MYYKFVIECKKRGDVTCKADGEDVCDIDHIHAVAALIESLEIPAEELPGFLVMVLIAITNNSGTMKIDLSEMRKQMGEDDG